MAQPVVQTIHRDPALLYLLDTVSDLGGYGKEYPVGQRLDYWVLMGVSDKILTGILRHYATVLMQATPKKLDAKAVREQRSLARGINLRSNASVLSPQSFQARKTYLISSFHSGAFLKEPENKGKPPPNPMTDPAGMEAMMGMMKGNMAMMIPQTLIMSWINAFFSGFIIMKLPFPLTIRFKSMLQSGVATQDLDVRWVSSLSWYFLNLFGLQSVFTFILGDDNAANQMAQQMGQLSPAVTANLIQPGQDPDKVFASEAENLEVMEHQWILEGVEDRLLKTLT